jgi:hypothetical protein
MDDGWPKFWAEMSDKELRDRRRDVGNEPE